MVYRTPGVDGSTGLGVLDQSPDDREMFIDLLNRTVELDHARLDYLAQRTAYFTWGGAGRNKP